MLLFVIVTLLILVIVGGVLGKQLYSLQPEVGPEISPLDTPLGTVISIPDYGDLTFTDEIQYSHTTFHAPNARVTSIGKITVADVYVRHFPKSLRPHVYIFGQAKDGWFHGTGAWSQLLVTKPTEWNSDRGEWSVSVTLEPSRDGVAPRVEFIAVSPRSDISRLLMLHSKKGEVEFRGDRHVLVHRPSGFSESSLASYFDWYNHTALLELFPPITRAIPVSEYHVDARELENTAFRALVISKEENAHQLHLKGSINPETVGNSWGIVAHDSEGRRIPSSHTAIDVNNKTGYFDGIIDFGDDDCRYLQLDTEIHDEIKFDVNQSQKTYTVDSNIVYDNKYLWLTTAGAKTLSRVQCKERNASLDVLGVFQSRETCVGACVRDARCNFCSVPVSHTSPWRSMRSCEKSTSFINNQSTIQLEKGKTTRLNQMPGTFNGPFREAIHFDPPLGGHSKVAGDIGGTTPDGEGFMSIEFTKDMKKLTFETQDRVKQVSMFDRNGKIIPNDGKLHSVDRGNHIVGSIDLSQIDDNGISLLLAHNSLIGATSCGLPMTVQMDPHLWTPIIQYGGRICARNILTTDGPNYPRVIEFLPPLRAGVDNLQKISPELTNINTLEVDTKDLKVRLGKPGILTLFDEKGRVFFHWWMYSSDYEGKDIHIPLPSQGKVIRYVLHSTKFPSVLTRNDGNTTAVWHTNTPVHRLLDIEESTAPAKLFEIVPSITKGKHFTTSKLGGTGFQKLTFTVKKLTLSEPEGFTVEFELEGDKTRFPPDVLQRTAYRHLLCFDDAGNRVATYTCKDWGSTLNFFADSKYSTRIGDNLAIRYVMISDKLYNQVTRTVTGVRV